MYSKFWDIKPYRYYLAYGSNLFVDRMARRCPYAEPIGTTYIPNHTLRFRKSKSGFYATVEPKRGEAVPAAVWKISHYDELLLDAYEGYPNYYFKKSIKTFIRFEKGVQAKINMFYALPKKRPADLPTLKYFYLMLDGYNFWGFPLDTLFRGLEKSAKDKNALYPFYEAV